MDDIDFSDPNEDNDDAEYTMTSKELLGLLEVAWLNEKLSPEILHHKSDLVDCMLDQLNSMQENLEKAKTPDIKLGIHRLEIERIRFILSSYLRKRLQKIEYFCSDLLDPDNPEELQKLTPQELMFAKEYQSNFDDYLKSVALANMPQSLQSINPKEIKNKPNIKSYVFMRVNKSLKNVQIDDDDTDTTSGMTIDLEEGDQHLILYKPLRNFLDSGELSLI